MYKYQCSKQECRSIWTLQEGNISGFALTCPLCGKGRGIFMSQTKREINRNNNEGIDEIIISVSSNYAKSVEELNHKIEEFREKYSLLILEKNIESTGTEVVCKIQYKLKN